MNNSYLDNETSSSCFPCFRYGTLSGSLGLHDKWLMWMYYSTALQEIVDGDVYIYVYIGYWNYAVATNALRPYESPMTLYQCHCNHQIKILEQGIWTYRLPSISKLLLDVQQKTRLLSSLYLVSWSKVPLSTSVNWRNRCPYEQNFGMNSCRSSTTRA